MSLSSEFRHWPESWPRPRGDGLARGEHGMVATTDWRASRVGAEVLESGGNAVDAAVAVSFALAVVNPEAGNVGGSGFVLIRRAGGETAALDYRGCAPAAATAEMFLPAGDRAGPSSELGHLAVAVPGSVRGLHTAHDRFGRLSWDRLVDPSVALAEGFTADERLLRSYEPHIVEGLARFPASARIFLPDGAPPRVGDVFRQSDLARTLARIRDQGPDGFYRGETAERIVDEMRRGGGLLTIEDLASYRAVWREPIQFRYRDHTVLSMPPSSSGGVTLAQTAHILSSWDVGALPWHGARHLHLLAEAWRRAYADRNHYLADPDHVSMPLELLSSAAYGAWRAGSVDPDAASRSARIGPAVEAFLRATAAPPDGRHDDAEEPRAPAPEGRHTTHVSVVDAQGNAVSLTTTLNTWYGSKVVAEGTGVLLNNEMDDFTARPGVPNHFGLVQGEANRIVPGKRMLSAMTPSMVLDPGGGLSLVLGTPGGSTIITTTFQVISNFVDFGMGLADAVAAPRVHHQHLPDRLDTEPGGLPPGVAAELAALGHDVHERTAPWGDVQAVAVGRRGSLLGVADPRRGGTALGI